MTGMKLTLAVALIAGIFGINIGFNNEVNTGNVTVSSGCIEGNGKEKMEEREISSFTQMEVDGAFDITVTSGRKASLRISGDSNVLPHIVSKVEGDTLKLFAKKSVCASLPISVTVETEELTRLAASGANDISVKGIDTPKFTVSLNGSGDIGLAGQTRELSATVEGSGNLHARSLQAEEVDIIAQGATGAEVYASRRLNAISQGVGDIRYYGNPADVKKSIAGVGDIDKGY